jgi:hypothetical protein
MDYDVASWVAEAVAGPASAARQRGVQQTPGGAGAYAGGGGGGGGGGGTPRRGFGVPPSANPSTPAPAPGFGGDATPMGTEGFLRRAREPGRAHNDTRRKPTQTSRGFCSSAQMPIHPTCDVTKLRGVCPVSIGADPAAAATPCPALLTAAVCPSPLGCCAPRLRRMSHPRFIVDAHPRANPRLSLG